MLSAMMEPHTQSTLTSDATRSQKLLSAMHGILSHDLPNQMVAVTSFLQLLLLEERENLSEEGRELLDRVVDASDRANHIVTYLKEVSRLDRYRPFYEDFSLASFVQELAADLTPRFEKNGVQIVRKVTSRSVSADRKLLLTAVRDVAIEIAKVTVPADGILHFSDLEEIDSVELRMELLNRDGRPITFSLTKDWQSVLRLELSELRMSVWGGEIRQASQNRFSFIIPDRHV